MSRVLDRNKVQEIADKHYTIDVKGLTCPYPELMVMGAIDKLSSGAVLEITLDNPPSVRDIPRIYEKKGHKILEVSKTDRTEWKITLQKK
jgi:TusA-related sulfurtransferase